MEQSYNEILYLLDLLGMRREVEVLRGASLAFESPESPQQSEGAEFIIERALAEEEPLYIAFLGPLTDMGSAYLMRRSRV